MKRKEHATTTGSVSPVNKLAKFETIEDQSKELFQWLIYPTPIEKFYNKHWESVALVNHRNDSSYYQNSHPLFTLDDLKQFLVSHDLKYGQNIDITNYNEGKRVTLNEPGESVTLDHAISRFEKDKCTLRVLHPQEFSDELYHICTLLQEWFGCVVGANVYITPPNAQGFAPHYDDVDVFILQVEGRKKWKLYHPRSEEEALPEVSSGNFEQDEIGECFKEVWLEQGDMMYFPRGVIHQAITDDSAHSTHITISTVQKWTWYHYLLKAVPAALRVAFEEDIEFRKTLPRQFQGYMGVMFSDIDTEERNNFAIKAQQLAQESLAFLPFDAAADQMAVEYIHDSLPPINTPTDTEKAVISLDKTIRLVSKSSVRITCEGESIFFYYNTRNTRQYHEIEPQFLEFPLEASEALEFLIESFPAFVAVRELPLEFDEDKIEVTRALYAAKIILIH